MRHWLLLVWRNVIFKLKYIFFTNFVTIIMHMLQAKNLNKQGKKFLCSHKYVSFKAFASSSDNGQFIMD